MIPFIDVGRENEIDNLFYPTYARERGGTFLLLVVVVHCYYKLLTDSSAAEIVPTYLSLVVYCFVIRSMSIKYLGVVKRVKSIDEEGC